MPSVMGPMLLCTHTRAARVRTAAGGGARAACARARSWHALVRDALEEEGGREHLLPLQRLELFRCFCCFLRPRLARDAAHRVQRRGHLRLQVAHQLLPAHRVVGLALAPHPRPRQLRGLGQATGALGQQRVLQRLHQIVQAHVRRERARPVPVPACLLVLLPAHARLHDVVGHVQLALHPDAVAHRRRRAVQFAVHLPLLLRRQLQRPHLVQPAAQRRALLRVVRGHVAAGLGHALPHSLHPRQHRAVQPRRDAGGGPQEAHDTAVHDKGAQHGVLGRQHAQRLLKVLLQRVVELRRRG